MFTYGVCRFILELFRDDVVRGIFGVFSTSQWISSIIILFIALRILWKTWSIPKKKQFNSKKLGGNMKNTHENKTKRIIIYFKLFISNIIIFALTDIIILRIFKINDSISSLVIGTIVAFIAYGTYGKAKKDEYDIRRSSVYFWGMIIPFVYGYFIYYKLWSNISQSSIVTPNTYIDIVYMKDGYLKGVIMTFIFNPASEYGCFTRVFVLILSLFFRIWGKDSRIKENTKENEYGSNRAHNETNRKSYNENDETQEEQTEDYSYYQQQNNDNKSDDYLFKDGDFFKGVKNASELKERYYALMKIYHPDNISGDNELTKRITKQYEDMQAKF